MNEAELLFTDILNCDRLSLYLNKQKLLDRQTASSICRALKRRMCGEPIEYILGKCEFMGLEFKVNKDVFIPRPETEILVETVLRYTRQSFRVPVPQCPSTPEPQYPSAQRPSYSASVQKCIGVQVNEVNILDIGTGSGCVAISLAKFLLNVKISATDISQDALEIAHENAVLNNVQDKINFINCDLIPIGSLQPTAYDLIVSNPPYISREEIKKLSPEIQYEPVSALDGGKDGLDFYRRIIQESPRFLRKGGFLILEMGFNQCSSIKEIFNFIGKFEIIEVVKDYNSIQRVIVAQLNTPDDYRRNI